MNDMQFNSFVFVGFVAVLGAISPGPDCVIVAKNSLSFSRKSGIFTAIGISLGVFVHMAYCFLSLSFFMAESATLFHYLKFFGAAYLIYIGVRSLLTQPDCSLFTNYEQDLQAINPFKALQLGFLTNALNPQATLFFLSLFSQVIESDTSVIEELVYAMEIWSIVLAWYCFLACLVTLPSIRLRMSRIQLYLEKGMGLLLIGFGLKVALI